MEQATTGSGRPQDCEFIARFRLLGVSGSTPRLCLILIDSFILKLETEKHFPKNNPKAVTVSFDIPFNEIRTLASKEANEWIK